MKSKTIDLSIMAGRVYVGRKNGHTARKYFELDLHEQSNSYPIEVIFPSNAKTLASSFFLGMFGQSVRNAGNKNLFFERYKFTANQQIMKEIEVGISEALSAGK